MHRILNALIHGPTKDNTGDVVVTWHEAEGDDYYLTIDSKPCVVAVTDRLREQADERFQPLPESLGYRFVKRAPECRWNYYARPLALWLVLRGRQLVADALYWAAKTSYGRLWHVVTPEGVAPRWRDIRLGPEGKTNDL